MFNSLLKPFFIFLSALFILMLFSCNVKKKIYTSGISTIVDNDKNFYPKDSIERNKFPVETKINKIGLEDNTLIASTNETMVYINTPKKPIFDLRLHLSPKKSLLETKNKVLKAARLKTKEAIALDDVWKIVSLTIGLLIIIVALFAFLTSNIIVGVILSVLALLAIIIAVSSDTVSEAILYTLEDILSLFYFKL